MKEGEDRATVLVCQCRSLEFEVAKVRKKSIDLKCSQCGLPASVKAAGVNSAPFPRESVTVTSRRGVTTPGDQKAATKSKAKKRKNGGAEPEKKTLAERGMKTFRFLVTEEQAETVNRAFEAIRLLNLRDERFRAQTYQAHAIEYMAADFLGGVPPIILSMIDASDELIQEQIAQAEKEGKPFSVWKIRRLRSEARDDMFEKIAEYNETGEIGEEEEQEVEETEPVQDAEPDEDPGEEEGGEEEEDEDDDGTFARPVEIELEDDAEDDAGAEEEPDGESEEVAPVDIEEFDGVAQVDEKDDEDSGYIDDDGRLYDAVVSAFQAGAIGGYYVLAGEDAFVKVRERWNKAGGHFLKVIGDPSTLDQDGERPIVFVWMEGDEDVSVEDNYRERFPGLEVTVIELVDQGDPPWEPPTISDTRMKI